MSEQSMRTDAENAETQAHKMPRELPAENAESNVVTPGKNPAFGRTGLNVDAVSYIARQIGACEKTVRKRLLLYGPREMYKHTRTNRVLVRNTPAFLAWYSGFGIGPDAVQAWREWAITEPNQSHLATMPEPSGGNFYYTSAFILRKHLERINAG